MKSAVWAKLLGRNRQATLVSHANPSLDWLERHVATDVVIAVFQYFNKFLRVHGTAKHHRGDRRTAAAGQGPPCLGAKGTTIRRNPVEKA